MPRNRQFISYFLRTVRKYRLFKGIVVINVSPQLIAILKSFRKLDESVEISNDYRELRKLDKDISTVLSRGKVGYCLPLLLPFVQVDPIRDIPSIHWVGLSGISQNMRHLLVSCLDHLYEQDQKISWLLLWEASLLRTKTIPDITIDQFVQSFKSVCRCNKAFFKWDNDGCLLLLSQGDLYTKSFHSMKVEFDKSILPKARHKKSENVNHFLYDLAWHDDKDRFRRHYYKAWNVLNNYNNVKYCSSILLRKAYSTIGESFLDVIAIISVTSSAGLLGREISLFFGIDFWEAPSIYDIDNKEWLPNFQNQRILIVTDIIDTKFLTKKLIKRVADSNGKCTAILALLQNIDNKNLSTINRVPVISVSYVSLGKPSQKELTKAKKGNDYYEIDVHTLDPIPTHSFQEAALPKIRHEDEKLKKRLKLIEKMLFFGHFIHSTHHYNIYFSLPHAMNDSYIRRQLIEWVINHIYAHITKLKIKKLHIVYPYYSPIFLLIDALRLREFENVDVQYNIALPQQKTGDRIGYTLDLNITKDEENHAVFLDDGIASGGTFASIVEQLIEKQIKSILVLILFDRIGLQPRKHLTYINTYKSENKKTIKFIYKTFFSANLKTYYKANCPECKLIDVINELARFKSMIGFSIKNLVELFRPILVSFTKTQLISRFKSKELVDIITFNDAIFSDIPSNNEIGRSINSHNKAAITKLDNITRLLVDRKLSSQFVDKSLCTRIISESLEDVSLQSEDRSRFILYLILCYNKKYSFKLLTEILPLIFSSLKNKKYGISNTLDDYFDNNRIEFISYCVALYHVAHELYSEKDFKNLIQSELWSKLKKLFNANSPYGSIYLFELTVLFSDYKHQPLEQANNLIANFLGTYGKSHPESLYQRLRLFLTIWNSDGTYKFEKVFSRPLFLSLIEGIKSTQELFLLDDISHGELKEVEMQYENYRQNNKKVQLVKQIKEIFISSNPSVYKSKIVKLLNKITPNAQEILNYTLEKYYNRMDNELLIEKKIEIPENTYVLCEKEYFIATLYNLLKNPTQLAKQEIKDKLKLKVHVELSKDKRYVCFKIYDNLKTSKNELKTVFMRHGGLSVQQAQIRNWHGDIEVSKRIENTCFTLRLIQIFK